MAEEVEAAPRTNPVGLGSHAHVLGELILMEAVRVVAAKVESPQTRRKRLPLPVITGLHQTHHAARPFPVITGHVEKDSTARIRTHAFISNSNITEPLSVLFPTNVLSAFKLQISHTPRSSRPPTHRVSRLFIFYVRHVNMSPHFYP